MEFIPHKVLYSYDISKLYTHQIFIKVFALSTSYSHLPTDKSYYDLKMWSY